MKLLMPLAILRRFRAARTAGASRLQRRARDLMSLASLAGFVAGIGWLVIGTCLVLSHAAGVGAATSHAHHLPVALQWLPAPEADYRVLALAWLLGCAATLAPLVTLRHLGKALWQQPSLNLVMARRFRTLAHALLFSLLGGWVSVALASTQPGQYQIGFGMGTWSLLAAILLAYIVAELVREGATAAAENRAFV